LSDESKVCKKCGNEIPDKRYKSCPKCSIDELWKTDSWHDFNKLLGKVKLDPKTNPLTNSDVGDVLSTNTMLDELFGGGIRGGQLVELYGEYACHSEDTMVFAPDGIKKYNDLNIGDAVFGMKNGYLVETKILNKFEFPFEGQLLHFKSKRYDFLVTRNHKMIYKPKNMKKNKFRYSRADELDKECYILPSIRWQGTKTKYFNLQQFINIEKNLDFPQKSHPKEPLKPLPINDFLRFLGWYISEGSLFVTKRGTYVQIRNISYIDEITKLLDRLGFDYSVYKKGKIVVFHRDLAEYCKRCGSKFSNKILNLPSSACTMKTKPALYSVASNRHPKVPACSTSCIGQPKILFGLNNGL